MTKARNSRERLASGGPVATQRLVKRIHLLSQLAKLAINFAWRRTAYRHKKEAVLHFARLYPEEIWVERVEALPGGSWLFSLRGFRLGAIHLLAAHKEEVLAAIPLSSRLRARLDHTPA